MDTRVWLRTFGALRLERDGEPVTGVSSHRHRLALLALLAASPGRQVSRDRALALLWPERSTDRARTLLNTAVHAIRTSIGAPAIQTVGDNLVLDAHHVSADVACFAQFVEARDPASAVALYVGPFLDGFHVPDSDAFDAWQMSVREQLHVRVATLLESLADLAASPADVRRWTERLSIHDPFSASAALRHMHALAAVGERAVALQFAAVFQARYCREFDTTPDLDVLQLAASLRHGPGPASRSQTDIAARRRGAASADAVVNDRRDGEVATVVVAPTPTANDTAETTAVPEPARSRSPRPERWTRRRALLLGLLTVGALVAGIAGASLRSLAANEAGAASNIVVLPFQVHGGSDLDYLGVGLMDVLSSHLNAMGPISTIDANAVLEFLDARKNAGTSENRVMQLAAEHFDAGRAIVGSLVEIGPRVELRASLMRRDGTRERDILLAGERSTLPTMVQDLVKQLLAVSLASAGRDLPAVAVTTTDSLAALRSYLEGEQSMRAGRHAMAVSQFERAVSIDSLFALAFYRLGEAQRRVSSLAQPWWERPVHQEAVRLAARLPPFERDLVRTTTLSDADALPILLRLVRQRPTSAEAQFLLGLTLDRQSAAQGTPNATAIEHLERALSLDTGHVEATRALAFAVARAGDRPRMQELTQRLKTLPPDDALLARSFLAFGGDDVVAQRQILDAMTGAPDQVVVAAAAAITTLTRRGDLSRPLYEMLTVRSRPDTVRWLAHTRLADLAAAEGRWHESAREIALADAVNGGRVLGKRARLVFLPFSPLPPATGDSLRRELLVWFQRRVSPEGPGRTIPGLAYNAGMISASRRDTAGIREALHLLQTLEGTTFANRVPLLRASLEAEIAWIADQPERVIALLTNAADPNSNQRYLLARALEKVGRSEEAIRWYRSYPDLSLNAANQLGWRAASLLRLADLHDSRGEPALAQVARREFVALWRNADPALQPIVSGARTRLNQQP